MTDAIFNTLLAVAQMCSSHVQNGSVIGQDFMPTTQSRFQPGFDQCAMIVKALDAEKQRRAEELADEKTKDDKTALDNGLRALTGRPFIPEAAPERPKNPYGGCLSVEPTYGAHPL